MTTTTTSTSTATSVATAAAGGALAELLAERELAQATRLARRGHYAEAETALSAARTTPSGLDLRARIAAQQGRYDEAAGLWRSAAERLGDPDAFAGELAAITRLQSRRLGRAPRAVAGAVALGVVVGSAAWVVSTVRSSDDAVRRLREDALEAIDRQAEDSSAADAVIAERLDDLASRVPSGEASGGALDSVDERLRRVAGVETTRDGERLQLRFTEAVFGDGTSLTPAGLVALAEVAGALVADADRLLVVVTGHTDPLPLRPGSGFDDNQELLLARAQAGVDGLVAAGLPGDVVTVRVTATPPPYPETGAPVGEAADARNRTVTLTIHERTAPSGAG